MKTLGKVLFPNDFSLNQMLAKVRKKGAPKSEWQKLLYGSVYCENYFKEARWRDSKGS